MSKMRVIVRESALPSLPTNQASNLVRGLTLADPKASSAAACYSRCARSCSPRHLLRTRPESVLCSALWLLRQSSFMIALCVPDNMLEDE